MLVCLCIFFAKAQNASNKKHPKFSQLSVKGGVDIANKKNFSDYVKMPLSGFNSGLSFDNYWSWIGLGIDVDYLENAKPNYDNKPLGTRLTTDLGAGYNPVWLTERSGSTKLSRLFLGIGPSFKTQNANGKFVAELNLRGGVTLTNGSSLYYSTLSGFPFWLQRNNFTGVPTIQSNGEQDINNGTFYHKGYTKEWLGTAKAQVRLNYYFIPKVAVNVSGYYMHYFGSAALYNYLDVKTTIPSLPNYWDIPQTKSLTTLNSYGASIGLSYKFGGGEYKSATTKNKSNSTLNVTVKDELTEQPLNGVTVSITNDAGITFSSTTTADGKANFTQIAPGNYKVRGTLNEIPTTQQNVVITATNKNGTATIIHNDPRFTVQGKAINLGNNKPEGGVSVTLKNKVKGSVKMGTSQSGNGTFSFQLDANTDYELVGKKASYISNIEKISTKGLTRSQTLYVELELGVEAVVKNKALLLNKIYYDLNKANIREDASSDLEKMVVFLEDNASFTIEIASHTDSRGDALYNQKLSQDRAQAVVNFLVSKGIAKQRLLAKGYGESILINRCADGVNCTEEDHQANRRTEFKVLEN